MLVILLGFYALTTVGFVWAAVQDDPRGPKELRSMIWAAICWPVYHLPWRDFSGGKHRPRTRHDAAVPQMTWQMARG